MGDFNGKLTKIKAYTEVLEPFCKLLQRWKNYGTKEIDGVNMLCGPGMDCNKVIGVIRGGGSFPPRLRNECEVMMGEIDEDKIYDIYQDAKKLGPPKSANYSCTFTENICTHDAYVRCK